MSDLSLNCYEHHNSTLHGEGIFATKDITAGKLIMNEAALWTVSKDSLAECYPINATTDGMYGLIALFNNELPNDKDHQTLLHRLSNLSGSWSENGISEDLTEAEIAALLNEVIIKNGKTNDLSPDKSKWVAVFDTPSKINHSCMLCAEQILFRPGVDQPAIFSLVAARDISRGEEITVQYTRSFATTEERQTYLQEVHEFTCKCQLCSQGKKRKAATDRRRQKAGEAVMNMRSSWKVLQETIVEDAKSAMLASIRQTTIKQHAGSLLNDMTIIVALKLEDQVSEYACWDSLCAVCPAAAILGFKGLQMENLQHAIKVGQKYRLNETEVVQDLVQDLIKLRKELAHINAVQDALLAQRRD